MPGQEGHLLRGVEGHHGLGAWGSLARSSQEALRPIRAAQTAKVARLLGSHLKQEITGILGLSIILNLLICLQN